MFGANSEMVALCSGYSPVNVAPNLPTVPRLLATTGRTVFARDTTFPLVDTFHPVTKALVPVPGLNQWPGRYNVLGRRYYGLEEGGAAVALKKDAGKIPVEDVQPGADEGLKGFGDFFSAGSAGNIFGGSTIQDFPGIERPSGGSSILDSILRTISTTLPATISALKKQPYYNPNQQQQDPYYQTQASGVYSDPNSPSVDRAIGGVSSFISQNTGLVLILGAGALLLFMRPPGKR